LTYDNNGNLQTITDPSGTTTYTWNARNQLTGISGPGMSASFVYDGLGRREKKTINGSLTEFLYDGLNPVQETSGATILANILPGLGIDEFLTRTDVVAGVTSSFLTDALGSPIAVTDNTGTVQTEYTYEPFGKTTFTGSSNSSSYQYTGRENDGTGLYYYRNRYYHPLLQRFVSEDPIEFGGGGFNLYSYVGNNPLRYIDPLGLCFGKNCDLPPGSNKSNPPKPVPPDPCKTMDCSRVAASPQERCKTSGQCLGSESKPDCITMDCAPGNDPTEMEGWRPPTAFEHPPAICPGCFTRSGSVYDSNGEPVGNYGARQLILEGARYSRD
jgi:RHS repeat-associated protein